MNNNKNSEVFEENFSQPPYANRGVVNTLNADETLLAKGKKEFSENLLIDWLQFTLFNNKYHHDIYTLIYLFFGINRGDVEFLSKGRYGYTYTYKYKNINVYISDREDMGIHFELSGQACRDYENLGKDFKSLIEKIFHYDGHVTRIDIAIDVFDKKVLSTSIIRKHLKEGSIVSKFKSVIEFTKKKISEYDDFLGDTISFGTKASNVYIVFYDKLLERKSANYLVSEDINHWVRCETRIRSLKAQEFTKLLYFNFENLGIIIKEFLYNYIDFKDNSMDINKSRWKTSKWWLSFLNITHKLSMSKVATETSITKKRHWLDSSTSKTQFSVFISELDIKNSQLVSNYLYNNLMYGYEKLEEKDLILINEERIKNNLDPLSLDDIDKYMREIKDIIVYQ